MNKKLDAIILCGGRGERLRPLTDTIPKPLIPIKGKPILHHIIEYFNKSPLSNFIIAAGYKANMIEDYMKNFKDSFNCSIIDSGQCDIIIRIKECMKKIPNKDFLVLYGDTLSDINILELIKFHKNHGKKATVTLWQLKSQFGLMEISKEGLVESYIEKPTLDKWINIGYFYFSKEIQNYLKNFDKFEVFLKDLIKNKELYSYRHYGMHITVNTHKELSEAEQNIDLLD